ncbi:LytR family transcriptional regulator [Streptomyces griseoviridis]|uniref:Transcriptional regulator n=1 Tax=Streptomyces griseoviridis TaxID=45398 RepID=A0A3S9Z948_STRGD|nr:LCP family protein [Streptomyces griseoviridis]AZS84374.1 LytR family transcriptional regulator [Streptomyces griseoviridis]QCN88767.1 transcriptional regulator [Streptomyces griseoviridis]
MTVTSSRTTARPRHRGDRPPARDRRRRRGGGRLRTVLVVCLAVLVLVAAGAGWLYLKLNGNISTFDSDGLSDDRPDAASSKGENVLVIGSDARTGGNSALGGGDKSDIGRSDTAFLLHIYADHRHALAVSIPRDTLVTIPPCKLPDGSWTTTQANTMFNAAYSVGQTAKGNPACTQNTVEELTGMRVDHTVVVDFKGFARLTEVVGGVKVCLPQDIYQKDLNPNRATRGKLLFEQGEQSVSGERALDYVRIRHGIGDGSDIGRIKRQQAFVASLLKKVKSDGLTPTKLLPLADAATASLTVDSGLGSADKLISFVMSLKDIDLHNTKFVTVPWRYEGSRVAVVEPDADALWAALKADRTIDGKDASGGTSGGKGKGATATPSPSAVDGSGVSVTVYNGTAVSGLAARAADELTAAGFTVTGTATATSQDHATTVIQYGPGLQNRARKVAQLFPGAELREIGGAVVNVVLGQTFATAAPATAAPSAVPSGVSDEARSADDDPCSDLSYG